MATRVDVSLEGLSSFIDSLNRAAKGEFKKELELFLEGIGMEFLRITSEEIVRRKVLDTRQLLTSFDKGSEGNVWRITDGGLTLEVGTSVKYAKYVNDGHWLNPKGVDRRFVPGYWDGDRFIYDPSSDEGMTLKQQWVPGSHYWESGLRILEKLYPQFLDKKLQEWMDNYFGG